MKTKLSGFTLLEVVLTVGLILLSVSLVTAWTVRTLDRTELQTTTESLVGLLRELQIAARQRYGDTHYGLRLESEQYIRFQGDSFDTSPPESRLAFTLPSSLQIGNQALNGGVTDVLFLKGKGTTDTYGSFQMVHLASSDAFLISISPLGLIDWQ